MDDIRDLLTALGVDFKEHGQSPLVSPGWIGCVCPWCGAGTNKPGLGINIRTLRCTCWKCSGHHIAAVLAEITSQPWATIKRHLAELTNDGAVLTAVARALGKYREPAGVGPLLSVHRDYLARRRFDPDQIAAVWGVQGIGLAARLPWRLFLPVLRKGKPVSWTTRAVGKTDLRYISADPEDETLPLKSDLYGSWLAKDSVVVVEGPTDAWRIGPGAVATYGLSCTPAQVAAIARYSCRCICFDNEPTAQRRARKLADDLAALPGETHVAVLSGPDPDSSPEDELAELRERFLA